MLLLLVKELNWQRCVGKKVAPGSAMPSTVIRNYRYLPQERQMEITFVNGRRYLYRDVPEDAYRGMQTASSRGEFFNRNIRDHYAFERLDDIKAS
jgi:hypothetical protein